MRAGVRTSVATPRESTDVDGTLAVLEAARDLLGYEPSTGIREGVSRFVEWYRTNREWDEPYALES